MKIVKFGTAALIAFVGCVLKVCMLVVASFKKLGVLSLVYMKLCSLSKNARSLSRLFIFINF